MKKIFLALLALTWFSSVARAEPFNAPMPVPLWGGVAVHGLNLDDDMRAINVGVPLPALPYLPKLSFYRHAYETQRRFGGWQSGGARTIRAHLPFGFTLEAGHRLDRFGRRDNEFVGLTFTYSHLSQHHENWHHGRLGADRGAPIPEDLRKNESDGRFWKIAGSVALVAALASGGGGGGGGGAVDGGQDQERGDIDADGWQMIWRDEFSGTALDTNNWNTDDSYGQSLCWGGGNEEQQCYADIADETQDNISVVDGKLIFTARAATGSSQPYTSGRVQSKGKGDFTYGKFEARIKLPTGQGSWPAFWMLPTPNTPNGGGGAYGTWAQSGEIDIMEAVNLGGTADNCAAPCKDIHGTLHFGGEWPNNTQTPSSTFTLNDINAFHTYTLEWYPDEMRWFVDGAEYGRKTQDKWFSSSPDAAGDPNAPFDQDFHLILNFAVGGRWPGNTDGLNFPRQMEVDYVRVYECADGPSACKQ